jgi:hypothetical protein
LVSDEYMCASLRSAHINFSKEKKRKKRKKRKPLLEVEGFKKTSFSEKILPDISTEIVVSKEK